MQNPSIWARELVSDAKLGDARRVARLVEMVEQAALRPAGRVTEVFEGPAARQAAYDLLESEHVCPEQLTAAVGRATARACDELQRALVVLDGTSLTFPDSYDSKGLGHIGSIGHGARGLKLINAIAVSPTGVPMGVADQNWWTRTERAPRGVYRRIDDRESARWRECVTRVGDRFAALAPETKLHFIADREGDAALLMRAIEQGGHEYTIRSNANRRVVGRSGPVRIRPVLARKTPLAMLRVTLPRTPHRAERSAKLAIRVAKLDVRMRDHFTQQVRIVPLTYVWARETSRPGDGVDWMLATNTSVTTADEALETVRRYTLRWRIEDHHRTWKSGLCNVERSQLRSVGALTKWATILAAVAARAETLRHHARTTPDAPAESVLADHEIDALIFMKTRQKSRVEVVSADGLTVAKAVRWIADLGGYVGSKSSGQPGPTTIGRGLARLLPAAEVFAALHPRRKKR